ncbi:hypothetical protein [Natrinema longum]|uniref:hypothetical protein n=1 Tax=Natrinema longum TaxID=370324 RepID=UPI001CCD572F|nr:hypothetical protein [Natrinema longum]MBZ6496857.1 hypothetical protein [Natrinema longum]
MRSTLYRWTIQLLGIPLIVLGIIISFLPVYIIISDSFAASLVVFSSIGLIMIVFGVLLTLFTFEDIETITVNGKTFGIGNKKSTPKSNNRQGSQKQSEKQPPFPHEFEKTFSEKSHLAYNSNTIGDMFEGLTEREIIYKLLSIINNNDPLQKTIDELSKQIAIKKFIEQNISEKGLRIVRIDGEYIVAAANEEIELVDGLVFNIHHYPNSSDKISELVGKAVLVESQSSNQMLFEFRVVEWKYNDSEQIEMAKDKLKKGRGRMNILTDGIVETDRDKLVTARTCLQSLKLKRDTKYDT